MLIKTKNMTQNKMHRNNISIDEYINVLWIYLMLYIPRQFPFHTG